MSKIKKYLDNKGLATLIEQIKKFGKVKTVDTNEPDEDGDVESVAVLNVDELPAEPKGKVYIYLDNTENENVYSSSFKALTSYTNKEINTPVYIQFNNERLKVYQDYASVNTRGRLTMSVLQRADSDNPGGFYGCYFPTEKGIVAYIPSLNGSYANELIGRATQFINDTSYPYAGTFTDENGVKYKCLGDYCRAVGIPYTVYGYISSSDALPPTVLQDKSGELHFYKSATATAQVYAKDKQLALYEDLEKAGKVKTVDGKNPDENGDIQLSWIGTKAEWTALDKSQFAGKGIIKVYFTDAETGAVVDTVEAGNMNAVTSNAIALDLGGLRFGKTADGKYGFYKIGEEEITPFSYSQSRFINVNEVGYTKRIEKSGEGSINVNATNIALYGYNNGSFGNVALYIPFTKTDNDNIICIKVNNLTYTKEPAELDFGITVSNADYSPNYARKATMMANSIGICDISNLSNGTYYICLHAKPFIGAGNSVTININSIIKVGNFTYTTT